MRFHILNALKQCIKLYLLVIQYLMIYLGVKQYLNDIFWFKQYQYLEIFWVNVIKSLSFVQSCLLW
jgi:hypothetical protein